MLIRRSERLVCLADSLDILVHNVHLLLKVIKNRLLHVSLSEGIFDLVSEIVTRAKKTSHKNGSRLIIPIMLFFFQIFTSTSVEMKK